MTVKEALEHLDAARIEWNEGYAYQKPRFEALDMAIEALKAQEPVEPVPTLDDDWACGLCERSVVGCEELDDGSFRPVKYNFCQHCGRPVKWG